MRDTTREVLQLSQSTFRSERAEGTLHPKLEHVVAFARTQRAAIVIDLDDTTVTGCVELHMKYARRFADRAGYSGPHPTMEDLLIHGTVQNFYEPHLPQIARWADHLRGSTLFHQGLSPMHPNMYAVFHQLEEELLLPSLALTARPPKLEAFSERNVKQHTGYALPVITMPNDVPLSATSEWKLENLIDVFIALQEEKDVFLLDDSVKTVSLVNSLQHPKIRAFLYSPDLSTQGKNPSINWENAAAILSAHLSREPALR